MASAAAVAVDSSKSPLPYRQDNDEIGTTTTITSRADGPAAINGHASGRGNQEEDDDQDEDDVAPAVRRKPIVAKNQTDDDALGDNADADADEGLFGSDEDEDVEPKTRTLDDDELDSGDDIGRNDRLADDDQDAEDGEEQMEAIQTLETELTSHPIPESSDGEIYLLRVPKFLAFEPEQYQADGFQAPKTDHHSKTAPSDDFSAYKTAMKTLRWRRSPNKPSESQSNARILRWSDGSMTLQLATDPSTQYPMPGNSLAPPQINPPKPTPTSKKAGKSGEYNPDQDSFTYLVAPCEAAELLRVTNKITTALRIELSKDASEDAVLRLQHSVAAAQQAKGAANNDSGSGIGFISITEDPELAKARAEQAEKEKLKAQRRRENQEARDRERTGRALGRRMGGGLTVGGLEDEDDMGMGAGRRAAPRKPRANRSRRGEIYSDDEDEMGHRARMREDEYDEEDDFVAPSDEEEEEVGGDSDEDEDEGIDVDEDAGSRSPAKRPAPAAREEVDAEGEPDDEAEMPPAEGSPLSRSKRRRIIEDDDEE